jgi:hypothetical protein
VLLDGGGLESFRVFPDQLDIEHSLPLQRRDT